MLKQVAKYCSELSPVFVDGSIYVTLAIVGSWLGVLSSETARTIIGPPALFWISATLCAFNNGLLALKMFRSTSFSEHQQLKRDKAQAILDNASQQQEQTNQEKTNDTKF